MSDGIEKGAGGHVSPFESIRRTNEAGAECWSSRDFAQVLEYTQYRNFEAVIEKAKLACLNSGHRIEDHFADVSKMIGIGKGGQREVQETLLSRYACYLAIQNADPKKEIVAQGQTYFATQTRRQELADQRREDERRMELREEMRRHNAQLADAARDAPNSAHSPWERGRPARPAGLRVAVTSSPYNNRTGVDVDGVGFGTSSWQRANCSGF